MSAGLKNSMKNQMTMKSNHSWGGRMRQLYFICLALILACLVAVYADYQNKCNELYTQIQIEKSLREKQVEDIEKDVRLLKTDVHILQYGYEENYDR